MRRSIVFSMALGTVVANAADVLAGEAKGGTTRLLWGDTHLHTMLSADANIIGNLAFTPEMAYRFAKGEVVLASSGEQAQLKRPLDFLVVADHAEYLGVIPGVREHVEGIQPVPPEGEGWLSRFSGAIGDSRPEALELVRTFSSGKPLLEDETLRNESWLLSVDAAENANSPGTFTALAGFEWTSQPNGNNLHRVVILRDGQDRTSQLTPLNLFESFDPEHLWDFLADYERDTGGQALAIPHNGNLSNGLMFTNTQFDGSAMDEAYAAKRARWEPVVEVTQIKGDGEAHPALSPDDEFADFGTWDGGNLDSTAKKLQWMLRYEYARSALKTGLELEQQTGANPYRFGMIGATDSHSGLSTADDDNFWGKGPPWEPGQPARIDSYFISYDEGYDKNLMGWDQLASGYAAVWAADNTREAIFDAMKRREVYGTTGPRIRLRYFAGWEFSAQDLERSDYAAYGYAHGVPMGATLTGADNRAPSLMVVAQRDPEGANLDRVQVVKGWVDANGLSHEKVYDVAWSDDRAPGADGKLPPVGNTVNLDTATFENTIGASELATVWVDPAFDASLSAFYYVRVLEIPTPRWVSYDRVRLGETVPEEAEQIHQERAYSSPVWYIP